MSPSFLKNCPTFPLNKPLIPLIEIFKRSFIVFLGGIFGSFIVGNVVNFVANFVVGTLVVYLDVNLVVTFVVGLFVVSLVVILLYFWCTLYCW